MKRKIKKRKENKRKKKKGTLGMNYTKGKRQNTKHEEKLGRGKISVSEGYCANENATVTSKYRTLGKAAPMFQRKLSCKNLI